MSELLALLAKVPPEAYAALGRLISALLSGDAARARREAERTAAAIAAKKAIRAGAKAAKRI